MRLKPLTVTAVLVISLLSVLGCLGLALPSAHASTPPGDSVIYDPPGYPPAVNIRQEPCADDATCPVITTQVSGDLVKMRCYTDTQTSLPRWFYVTVQNGSTPATDYSGYVYSDYVTVASQIKTPSCIPSTIPWAYPEYPGKGYITISQDPDSPGNLTVNTYGISILPATLYCHVGTSGDPNTGGQVTDLGIDNLPATGQDTSFDLPLCGSGTQWIGIIAGDGFVGYSNRITVGGGSGPASIVAGNDNGQLSVQLVNFPLGLSYYFCHVGSGYPTGGSIASHGSFTVSSSSQSWSSGLCSGSGNFWIGIQATDGNSYYSNQVTLNAVPPSILVGNNDGQMSVQLVNFPLGLSYYFCHAGEASGYPTGGSIASHGSFTVSSSSQSWPSGLCSGSGNFWIGIQATDGNSYYSNQAVLGPPPAVATTGLPGGILGKPYSATLQAAAGTGSFGWSITGGALPEGLSLAADGVITGTPKASGRFTVVVRATDADQYTASRSLPLSIAALGVKTTALPVGTVRRGYKTTLAAYGGRAPLNWVISGGRLPPGLKLSRSGVISGTPTKAGAFALILRVTDTASPKHAATRTLILTIKK
jgi:hypothetical protein